MNCVSYDICVYHIDYTSFGLFVFFPWGIPQLQSDWSLSCDHRLDYASYVRTTTTTLNEDTEQYALSEYHTHVAKMSFDEISDLTAVQFVRVFFLIFCTMFQEVGAIL